MGGQRQSCVVSLVTLLATLSSAVNLDCKHLQSDRKVWDIHSLGGAHSLYHVTETDEGVVHNTTYTVNVCQPLKSTGCKGGTYVCGAVTMTPKGGEPFLDHNINIAGNYVGLSGKSLDPRITNLKKVDEREGVRLELHGGKHPFESRRGEEQMAVIDFVCDPDRTGLEGLVSEEEDKEQVKTRRAAYLRPRSPKDDDKKDDDKKDDEKDDGDDDDTRSLRFKSYGHDSEHNTETLHLEWRTKYVCDSYEGEPVPDPEPDPRAGNHWGFFTWFIVLAFLGASAYLIFGSWLNYNRYGARGWDMLPHSDALRDVPYLFRDWARRVINTISGPGSRGGYSAV